jgi:carbonic anhydrase
MKKLKVLVLAVASVVMSASLSLAVTPPHTTLTPDQAFARLQAGNAQFVKGRVLNLTAQSQPAVRISAGTIGQGPSAVVLGCIDSRVPPEVIFDRGLNEVFSTRVAGNVIAPHEIGSIEYAVEHVEVPLIVILGHSKCGAVTSSVQYAWPYLITAQPVPVAPVPVPPAVAPGNFVNSLVNSLMAPIVATYTTGMAQGTLIEAAATENVKEVADSLFRESLIIRERIEGNALAVPPIAPNTVKIVTGKYDVVTGVVTWIPWTPPVP